MAEWMSSEVKETIQSGAVKIPDIGQVYQWVPETWNCVSTEIVIKSFKKCCVNSTMDGTRDDIFEI